MLELNSHCLALNLVLSQKCIDSKIRFEPWAHERWWGCEHVNVVVVPSEAILLSAAVADFEGLFILPLIGQRL